MNLEQGQVIDGRYRLISRLGTGGMADVWLADDPHLGREVALKVLHRQFAQDTEFVTRFRREAEAAAGLQHPNVVSIFDRGQVGDTYYIAMEYLRGQPLSEMIRGGLTIPQAIQIVREILEAARFAHLHGVIHRDFKPQNVIIDESGRVRVTDFGIARAGVSEITQSGSVMGTAHYLPPEQAQGLEVTAQSDLYSIGVILYECLTGQVPFHADSSVAVAMKHVSEEPVQAGAINPNVTPALDGVLARALAKDPSQRFASAEAFVAALDAAEREPAPAPGETAAYAPLPPAELPPERRTLWPWLLGIAVLLGVVLGILATRDTSTEVPNVTNPFGSFLTLAEAREELDEEGFELEEVRRVERMVPRDTVLEQDPAPGEASKDCAFLSLFCSKPRIALTVSGGPGQGEVPDVAGMRRADAERRLEAAGFGSEVRLRNSSTVEEGLVIATSPAPGETARHGSTVTLAVSSGPRMVGVPALIGLSEQAAIARLEERGLEPAVTVRDSEEAEGQVLEQSPDPGQRLAVGSSVSLVVSSQTERVSVPNLIGTSRPDAVGLLRGLGLRPVVAEREVTDRGQNNEVLEQAPASGSELVEGDTVSLVVGDYVPPPEPPGSPGSPAPPEPPPGDPGAEP